jgi:predicted glycoside hydrolase/deacetylase ChbG (UPF0249 family)
MLIVVNADDFGLSSDTVSATIASIRAGHVTSATLMPQAPASAEAIEFARVSPSASFGVHLTFGGDGSGGSVAPPSEVPALVSRAGQLYDNTNRVRLLAAVGRLPIPQLEREIEAQLEWASSHGVVVSHVDSHQHLHKYKPFREALARVLPRFGLTRVRNVQDIYLGRPRIGLTAIWGNRWRRAVMAHFTTTDHLYMPASTGDASWTALLRRTDLQDSTVEIGVHPGEVEAWRRREAQGIVEFAEEAMSRGHRLLTWREI